MQFVPATYRNACQRNEERMRLADLGSKIRWWMKFSDSQVNRTPFNRADVASDY